MSASAAEMATMLYDVLEMSKMQARALADTLEQAQKLMRGECPHPRDKRRDTSTMTGKSWHCTVCDVEFTEEEPPNGLPVEA